MPHVRSFSTLLALPGVFVCGLVACGGEGSEPPPRATWYQDVAPILSQRCNSCHVEGGAAPFSLVEYENAKANGLRMMHQVEIGAMPPFDAREEADCTPRFGWVDDPRLTAEEKEKLQAWIDDGYALGTVAEIAPPPPSDLTGVTKSMVPEVGHATSGDRDQFICYVLDPGITGIGAWVDGMQVRPDLDEVVHHAVVTQLLAGAEQDALVAQVGIGRPFDCGTVAAPPGFVVQIWTPGSQPMETQPGLAVPIVGGAKLVMQIHYHPAGKTHRPDRTAIDLRITPTWPRKMLMVSIFGNQTAAPSLLPGPGDRTAAPEFRIPADAGDHGESMRMTVPAIANARIYSVAPHMHYVGTHASAKIFRPAARGNDPQTECLANGGWNFDWQRTYTYDTALDNLPSVAQGDVVELRCKWNNTLANPFVQRMLQDARLPMRPVDVGLGEQTIDEMCLEIFGLALDAPARPASAEEAMVLPALPNMMRVTQGQLTDQLRGL